jgi:hypothetical protein
MFTSQREKWADRDIVALVELDLQKMRLRITLAREAIRERLRELEHSADGPRRVPEIEDEPGNCGREKPRNQIAS